MGETFTCLHGRTIDAGGEPAAECDSDVRALAALAESGSGDQRAAALTLLLEFPCCVRFATIHEVAEALVGRSVWTHEFASPENLYAEARSQQHPVDLEAHVIGSLDQLMGNKPVIVVRSGDSGGREGRS